MTQTTTAIQNLLVIDSQVTDWQSLAAGAGADTAVLILDSGADGLTQINDYLSNASTSALSLLQSIQIISHGSAGSLQLGSSTISSSNLGLYSKQLAKIGSRLTDTGDILLYGCNVAAGQVGLDFINQFAALSSAGVAASTDLTGATALGGNWVLEAATGGIEATAIKANISTILTLNIGNNDYFGPVNLDPYFPAWYDGTPSLSNTSVVGTDLNDYEIVYFNAVNTSFNLGAGNDNLIISQYIQGTSGGPYLKSSTNLTIDMGSGDDSLTIWGSQGSHFSEDRYKQAYYPNWYDENTDYAALRDSHISLGIGNDNLTIIGSYTAITNSDINLGDGDNAAMFYSNYPVSDGSIPIVTIKGTSILAGNGADNITVVSGGSMWAGSSGTVSTVGIKDGSINLGNGKNTLNLIGAGNYSAMDNSSLSFGNGDDVLSIQYTGIFIGENYNTLTFTNSRIQFGDGLDTLKISTYQNTPTVLDNTKIALIQANINSGNFYGLSLIGSSVEKIVITGMSYDWDPITQIPIQSEIILHEFIVPNIFNPAINGTVQQGEVLTTINSVNNFSLYTSLGYEWFADGVYIGTGNSYKLAQVDVGKAITVQGKYADLHGIIENVISVATSYVANTNDLPTGLVTITGTATQNNVLTADTSTLIDIDGLGTLSFQWLENGTAISGENYSSLRLAQDQVGKTITVQASYIDGFGTNENVTSLATSNVINVNDIPTGTVTISGDITQYQTLTASNTLNDIDGLGTISYQWLANGDVINGATAETLALTQAQVGKNISVKASYIDQQGTTENVTSAATNNIVNVNELPTGIVNISGIATQNQILTASNTLADIDGIGSISYQWFADGIAINGANNSTLTLVHAQVDKLITVKGSYIDQQGTYESVTSLPTKSVNNVNDLPTGTVTISGIVAQNQALTASNNLADADGLGSISYQWLANGVIIDDAINPMFTLSQDQVGKAIKVQAKYTDSYGTAEVVSSLPTIHVENVNDIPTGTVNITGIARQNQTLTANNSLADIDGLGSLSYQWFADDIVIDGASGSTFILSQTQVGKVITVKANYTDLQGTAESVTSLVTTIVANINDTPSGIVFINGIPTQNQTLTATNNITDIDGLGVINYQWFANGVMIDGAITASLNLTQAQVINVITVQANYIDFYGTHESILSAATATIINLNDLPTGTVSINGTPIQGQQLIASNNLVDADGLGTILYTWYASGSAVSIGTGDTFTLTQAQVGKTITAVASYTDMLGAAESVSSSVTGTVANLNDLPTGTVSINGTPIQGQQLIASNNLVDADGLGTILYTWYASGSAVSIGTGDTFTLTQAQVGKTITAVASYTDMLGAAESVSSSVTGTVAGLIVTPQTFVSTIANETFTAVTTNDTVSYVNATARVTISLLSSLAQNNVAAGMGRDTLVGIANLIGSGFNDTLTGNVNNNVLSGGTGADTLVGGLGANTLTGGTGIDTFTVTGTDIITDLGNGGADILKVSLGAIANATVTTAWTATATTTNSGTANLTTNGLAVNLALVTTGTNGFSVTNTGIATTLTGSALADTLIGGGANDVLVGGTGADTLVGGLGANTLTGGTGIDTFTVTGTDTIKDLGAGGADILSVALGATANATVTTAWTATAVTTNSGIVNITTSGLAVNLALVTTGINGFKVTNTGAATALTGSALADTLTGGTGADTLVAGAGNDMLIGKAGNDRLTGGLGADTFWFDTATNATTNKDTITDFVTGTDKLQFSVSVLTALGVVGQFALGDQRFWSSATGLAHDATDRLIYNTATGALSYDSNGNVAGGAVIIEVLGTATHPALVATDMWVA